MAAAMESADASTRTDASTIVVDANAIPVAAVVLPPDLPLRHAGTVAEACCIGGGCQCSRSVRGGEKAAA
jgi:hypothetical protein